MVKNIEDLLRELGRFPKADKGDNRMSLDTMLVFPVSCDDFIFSEKIKYEDVQVLWAVTNLCLMGMKNVTVRQLYKQVYDVYDDCDVIENKDIEEFIRRIRKIRHIDLTIKNGDITCFFLPIEEWPIETDETFEFGYVLHLPVIAQYSIMMDKYKIKHTYLTITAGCEEEAVDNLRFDVEPTEALKEKIALIKNGHCLI